MILVADIIVRGALNRKESRGAHYRTDFPEPRKSRLYHNLLYQDSAGNVRTSNRPVDLSREEEADCVTWPLSVQAKGPGGP